MSKQFVLKSTKSTTTLSFLLCIDRCEMKNMQPLLLFFTDDSCYSTSVCLYESNFPYEGGHFIAHSIFKTCVHQMKDHFNLFLNTNTLSGKEAKMLIKLIVVDSNHFIRYKCKITHCLGS